MNALREQNARLKDVIKQMSEDIENIAAQNNTQNNTQVKIRFQFPPSGASQIISKC